MSAMRVLLVEDEARLAQSLKQGLGEDGMTVDWAVSAEAAEPLVSANSYDVIVLDLTLPGKDGLEFLREIRGTGNSTPVLTLTARGSLEDRVRGLETGSDDYLIKPFAFEELLARLHALARRGHNVSAGSSVLKVADLEFDTIKRKASRAGRAIALSPKEAMLLELLMRRAGQVVTRDMIAESVWDSGYDVLTNLIEVFVNRLRHKIDKDSGHSLITTVRGSGYTLRP